MPEDSKNGFTKLGATVAWQPVFRYWSQLDHMTLLSSRIKIHILMLVLSIKWIWQ